MVVFIMALDCTSPAFNGLLPFKPSLQPTCLPDTLEAPLTYHRVVICRKAIFYAYHLDIS